MGKGDKDAAKRGSTHSNRVDVPDPVSFPTSFNTSSRGTSRSRQAAADAAAFQAAAAVAGVASDGGGGWGDDDEVFTANSGGGGAAASSSAAAAAAAGQGCSKSKSKQKGRPRPAGSRSSSRKPAQRPSRPHQAAVFRTGGTESNSDDESTQVRLPGSRRACTCTCARDASFDSRRASLLTYRVPLPSFLPSFLPSLPLPPFSFCCKIGV